MHKEILFSKLRSWLASIELFERPSKKIPGKWKLFEYYFEPGNELVQVKEEQIKANNQYFRIEFNVENKFSVSSNLPVSVFISFYEGNWSIQRNYITFIHPEDFRKNLEFQFAFEKGNIKFLRKDKHGKIIFFGFFRKVN